MRTCWRRQRPSEQDAFRESSRSSIVLCSKGRASVSVGNQQHVDPFGSWSRGVSISSEKNCVVLVSATPSASCNQVCVNVIISPVSMLSLPTAHWRIVSGVKHLLGHAIVNDITHKHPTVIAKVDNIEHADHVVLLGVLDKAIMTVRGMVWRESSP